MYRIHWPVARSSAAFRALAKSSAHGSWKTRAPNDRAILIESSDEPVSTTTTSSTTPRTDVRHASRHSASSRTIMAAVSNGRGEVTIKGSVSRPVIEAVAGYGLPGSRLTFPLAALAQAPWEQLLELAVNHRVAGHLMRAVDDGALPVRPEQRIQAFHASRVERDYGRRVEQQLVAVAETFDTAGIDWRVLKGAAHAHLAYPVPELRSYVDIDILV